MGHTSEFLFGIYKNHNLKTQRIRILKNKKNCWSYHHFTHVYQKSHSYALWFLRYRVRQAKFLSFWAIFCLLLTTWKIKKWKKNPGDIILHLHTTNDNHVINGSCWCTMVECTLNRLMMENWWILFVTCLFLWSLEKYCFPLLLCLYVSIGN